jgi:hypothetical protein
VVEDAVCCISPILAHQRNRAMSEVSQRYAAKLTFLQPRESLHAELGVGPSAPRPLFSTKKRWSCRERIPLAPRELIRASLA